MALADATLPTSYEYYTGNGITAGLSDKQPYFTLNNKNITIYSGAFHYFRVPRAYWRDRLRKMRAAGLNTVETYVPWNLHEPHSGVYDFGKGGSDFEDFLHLEEFLKTAKEEDLFALVRPGPYICAEWEFGGLPSWILKRTQGIRTSADQVYVSLAKRYFNVLLPILALLQFQKGGPVIGFQIENEYGNTGNNDKQYLTMLRDMLLDHGIVELLYTSDPPSANGLGSIPGVLQTANFNSNPKWQLDKLNSLQKGKPTMTMEYWTGWFDHWTENHQTVPVNHFKDLLEEILDYPSSVNMYMFVGSTNFGFTNGANSLYPGMNNSGLQPTTTSYDYDAPLTEYGGYTAKYWAVKEVIGARNKVKTKLPNVPEENSLVDYPELKPAGQLLLSNIIDKFDKRLDSDTTTVPMELLNINGGSGQSFGYIVYIKSNLNIQAGAILTINNYVRDTVLVLVNGMLINKAPKTKSDLDGFGFWKLQNSSLVLTEEDLRGATLQLIVENFGRNNYGGLSQFRQFKGLTGDVYVDSQKISHWDVVPLEFRKSWNNALSGWNPITNKAVPAIYKFSLNISGNPQDTYLDMSDWNKGITIVNSFVLGRHFFLGPQQSLYLPAPLLKSGNNDILVFEHFNAANTLKFSNKPIFGSSSY